MTEEDDVIPLEITGSVKVYNQAYVDKQEKRIAELTEQNTSLLTSVENLNKSVQELEKENAELKLKLEALEGQTPWKDIKDKSEVIGQLSNAKEIIKKLINTCCSYGATGRATAEAEQFLNEVEK